METYEEVKAFLLDCQMKTEDYPEQKVWINGFPYWVCHNWEELDDALGKCTVPRILSNSFSGKDGLISVDIYDHFIWNNEDYRWNVDAEG